MNIKQFIRQIETDLAYEEGCLDQWVNNEAPLPIAWTIKEQRAYILGLERCLELIKYQ